MTGPLPPPVRAQVVALAADTLADIPQAEVPPSLAAVRRFTPSRRARLGAVPLAAALETDAGFRARVAERVRLAFPDMVAALERDGAPAAAPPDEVAAVAYVLRLPSWERLVVAAGQEAERVARSVAAAGTADEVRRLTSQLEGVRRSAKLESDRLRADLGVVQGEADDARKRLRSAGDGVRRAEVAAAESVSAAAGREAAAAAAAREAEAEAKRLRSRVAELEDALSALRRGSREARVVDDVRLRVLLDTLLSATAGVRRELALPPVVLRPADAAARRAGPVDPFAGVGGRGRGDDDPSLIDEVLAVPVVHLIVDGYNVTKRGYGTMPLDAQRSRLLAGLGTLAARTPEAEITVVFDATAVTNRPVAATVAPRGVRVVFSAAGELADQEIGRLVRAEPPGRAVAVVTSDREVADAARAAGARAIPSAALLARLG